MTLLLFAALLFLLFADINNSKIVTAILLIPFAVFTRILIPKKSPPLISWREVLVLVAVIGAIVVILLHMSGIYFGYYKNPYFVDRIEVILNYVLPLTVMIVASELIRSAILAQKNKITDIICFLSCIMVEMLTVSNLAGIASMNRFMDVVGLALLPAVSANIYYHYVSRRYGMIPNVVFRIITTLYVYFLTTLSSMPDALMSCIKILLPILMLAIISSLYEKKKRNAVQKGRKLSAIFAVLTAVIVIAVSMLISCQFRYGALVIATESMTGEINKGDMIIYEAYDDQTIKEGQVIVFLEHNSRVVHRVVKIDRSSGETHYYTKGDANEDWDVGYRTAEEIVGLTDFKLAYVGYPTLWLRDFIKNATQT